MRPRKVRVMTLSGQMIYTVAPHPDKQSLSAPARRHCEIVSNRSSGSRPGFHIDSHMPISCAFRIHYQWSHQVLHLSAFHPSLRVLPVAALSAPLQTKFHPPPRREHDVHASLLGKYGDLLSAGTSSNKPIGLHIGQQRCADEVGGKEVRLILTVDAWYRELGGCVVRARVLCHLRSTCRTQQTCIQKKTKALTHSRQLRSKSAQPCALEMRISGDSTPVQASNHWLDEIGAKSLLVQ